MLHNLLSTCEGNVIDAICFFYVVMITFALLTVSVTRELGNPQEEAWIEEIWKVYISPRQYWGPNAQGTTHSHFVSSGNLWYKETPPTIIYGLSLTLTVLQWLSCA